MNKTQLKKTLKIVSNILLYVFIAVCVFSVLFLLMGRGNHSGAMEIFGYQMLIVTTDSMAECEETDVSGYEIGSLPSRTLILVETLPEDPLEAQKWYAALGEGDVLTFRYVYTNQITITHRLVEKTPKDGGYILTLMGDNKATDATLLSQVIDTTETNSMNYVIGKVTGSSLFLGTILSFMRETLALVLIVILPCLVIIVCEIIKIIRAMGAEKAEREARERAEKEKEIAELRRRVAELEAEEKVNAKEDSE